MNYDIKKHPNNKVTITCYNKTTVMDRYTAYDFYMLRKASSEGSEHERYSKIVFGLLEGLDTVPDED